MWPALLTLSLDNSGQQGSGRQPGPGWHHLSYWWGQYRWNDAPGGPEQDQVCHHPTQPLNAEVNNHHTHSLNSHKPKYTMQKKLLRCLSWICPFTPWPLRRKANWWQWYFRKLSFQFTQTKSCSSVHPLSSVQLRVASRCLHNSNFRLKVSTEKFSHFLL